MSLYKSIIKPISDLLVSSLALLCILPVLIVIAVLLILFQGGNPLFIQKRVGLNNRVFYLVKFRTMKNTKDSQGVLLPDNKRLTKIGLIIRKTSLDELPQLLNVIWGNMSLVGPRPLLVEYLPLYSNQQIRRHNVKPGITGWAQVNGRNSLSWNEKFELDIYYVDNQSFKLDVQIIIKTIGKVLSRSDVNSSENDTMERFTGNN